MLGGVLFGSNFDVLVLDVEAKTVVDAHVVVGDPDQGKEGHEISAPSGVEHLEPRDDQEQDSDVVAETVLAGEQIKKIAPGETAGLARLALTIFAWLTKDFFVSEGPGSASHRNGQHQEPDELDSERHGKNEHGRWVGRTPGLRALET